jgi:hypothetical protein
MTYKIDNNTKIVTYNNEEFYPNLINGILIAPTEQECVVEKNRREQAKLDTFNVSLNLLREKRNQLLKDTDYLALSDNNITEEIKIYRQALRDITEGLDTISKVEEVFVKVEEGIFPVKPQYPKE